MVYVIVAAISLVVGAALAYAFRGWIERTKAKEAAALQQSAENAFSKAGGIAQGVIKKL